MFQSTLRILGVALLALTLSATAKADPPTASIDWFDVYDYGYGYLEVIGSASGEGVLHIEVAGTGLEFYPSGGYFAIDVSSLFGTQTMYIEDDNGWNPTGYDFFVP